MIPNFFSKKLLPIIVFFAIGAQSLLIYFRFILARGDFGWDAAHHTWLGLTIYSDVIHGNWISFLLDTYRQVYWPFLHSWFIAISMLFIGPTATASRIVSLIGFALTAVMLALLTGKIFPKQHSIAILVTLALWLTATNFIREFGTEALIESMAISMTAASFYILSISLQTNLNRHYGIAGLFSIFTYFTKTDYGIILIAAFLCSCLLSASKEPMIDMWKKLLVYLFPIVVLGLLWFAYTPKIEKTISALINRPQGPEWLSIDGILYHPNQLLFWSDSIWCYILLLVSFALSFRIYRHVVVRMILVYIVIAILLHSISQTKDPKHIVKILPWLFLLAGLQAELLWQKLITIRIKKVRVLIQSALILIFVFGIFYRTDNLIVSSRNRILSGTESVSKAICERINSGSSYLILGEFAEISPYLIKSKIIENNPTAMIQPGDLKNNPLEHKLKYLGPRHSFIKHFENNKTGPAFYVKFSQGRKKSLQSNPSIILKQMMDPIEPDQVMVISLSPETKWHNEDYKEYHWPGDMFLPYLKENMNYSESKVIEFQSIGIRLLVFSHNKNKENI